MIPGANILNMAFSVIAQQSFEYYQFRGRSVDNVGKLVNTYDPAVEYSGSVQAVPRTAFQRLGLDFTREYITIIASTDFVGTDRDYTGDVVKFNGSYWQLQTVTDWLAQDGWKRYTCVKVTQAPDIVSPYYD